jgi:pilus assembly protein Flp/PilA
VRSARAGTDYNRLLLNGKEERVRKRNLVCEDNGQDLVEYALLVALIALATVAALQTLSLTIGSIWTTILTRLIS